MSALHCQSNTSYQSTQKFYFCLAVEIFFFFFGLVCTFSPPRPYVPSSGVWPFGTFVENPFGCLFPMGLFFFVSPFQDFDHADPRLTSGSQAKVFFFFLSFFLSFFPSLSASSLTWPGPGRLESKIQRPKWLAAAPGPCSRVTLLLACSCSTVIMHVTHLYRHPAVFTAHHSPRNRFL